MKVIISGRAAAFDRENREITQPARLRALDGIVYEEMSCCDCLGGELGEIGLIGGLLRLAHRADGNQLRIVTEYQSPRALTPKELQGLVKETQAQWSDGIGESYFWQDVGSGVRVDLYPLFQGHELYVEQFDDGVAVPVPKYSRLPKAAEAGDIERIRQLLAQGEDVNATDRTGTCALNRAVVMGHVDAALFLIEQGADVRARTSGKGDLTGQTALHYACMNQKTTTELLEALVGKGADVNARDTWGWTPLMWAANRGRIDLVGWLLEHGADVNVRDTHRHNEGHTALMYTHHLDVIHLLLRHGADPNIRNDRGLASYEAALFQAGDGTRPGVTEAQRHQRWMAAADALLAVLKERAASGDAASQYTLAEYHDRGLGVPEDVNEAFRWYERSAGNGYRLAWMRLGLCHRDGHGTPADPAKALDCLHRAAQAGVPLAMGILGECSAEGQGVPQDAAEAARWYRRGAEVDPLAGVQPNELYEFRNGVAACRAELGACHEEGKGVAKDLAEALRWYQAALDLGLHAVATAIKRVQKKLKRR
jgi:hypothetical protein